LSRRNTLSGKPDFWNKILVEPIFKKSPYPSMFLSDGNNEQECTLQGSSFLASPITASFR
jgi:hypothetical protein